MIGQVLLRYGMDWSQVHIWKPFAPSASAVISDLEKDDEPRDRI